MFSEKHQHKAFHKTDKTNEERKQQKYSISQQSKTERTKQNKVKILKNEERKKGKKSISENTMAFQRVHKTCFWFIVHRIPHVFFFLNNPDVFVVFL